eukprot:TRINITY_DN8435_c0_g1_i2.p1 TRINITY_DN8435_c0_g1~~TRINITY_DN8435_c0_g1_i2.p1  ORF type:complete len:151 (-),score=8.70 TRINITY_DN8435_c0_g1_i2:226-678(-)
MPKRYSDSFLVRRHIACQQRRVNMSPVFSSTCDRATPPPWMGKQGLTDYDHSLPGVNTYFYNQTWKSPKVPRFNPLSRWPEAVEGKFLRRFMHTEVGLQDGYHPDKVIGVTTPEMVRHVKQNDRLDSQVTALVNPSAYLNLQPPKPYECN